MHHLLTIAEVCERYRMGERTVYRLITQAKFPKPIKVGSQNRWPLAALESWEASQ